MYELNEYILEYKTLRTVVVCNERAGESCQSSARERRTGGVVFTLHSSCSQSVMVMRGFRHNQLEWIRWLFLADFFCLFVWNLENFSRSHFSSGPDVPRQALQRFVASGPAARRFPRGMLPCERKLGKTGRVLY